jgi:hypothetical protein
MVVLEFSRSSYGKKVGRDGSSQRRESYLKGRSVNSYYCPPEYNSKAFLFSAEVHFELPNIDMHVGRLAHENAIEGRFGLRSELPPC